MSKEKKIEEMAKVINCMFIEYCEAGRCGGCPYKKYKDNLLCHNIQEATYLYNAGYRKQSEGEWNGNGYLKHCSECGNVVNFNNVSRWLYNFCPHCGAKMKGGE